MIVGKSPALYREESFGEVPGLDSGDESLVAEFFCDSGEEPSTVALKVAMITMRR